jgi:hypothetical protein
MCFVDVLVLSMVEAALTLIVLEDACMKELVR